MSIKQIQALLEQALLGGGEMAYALYEHELEELLDFLKQSMAQDKDEFIFSVTENTGDVAMVLIEKSGQVHINEEARSLLQKLWRVTYSGNMKRLIPDFARQLQRNEMPINGVKVVG